MKINIDKQIKSLKDVIEIYADQLENLHEHSKNPAESKESIKKELEAFKTLSEFLVNSKERRSEIISLRSRLNALIEICK
ncbi:hypothetical protein RQM65_06705 [Pricia sp. S334]|uniref:Uncharacterized protein n=1 Tax=Pricia mediterranea TaxID=3076079 RepID=A0ABU3L446_9FLAO|nr:hypothetical protein [Pricia sp. S334]MDT7828348.1 hypothetical protein [Pricia sp. S334]